MKHTMLHGLHLDRQAQHQREDAGAQEHQDRYVLRRDTARTLYSWLKWACYRDLGMIAEYGISQVIKRG